MSHHLAELVTDAETDASTEQRLQIVDLILRIWTNRRFLPDPPLAEFEPVLAALERLGDSQPWVFSRVRLRSATPPGEAEEPLVAAALELEGLVRETVLRLIWMAARDAGERNREWLQLADEVATNLESQVGSALDQNRLAIGVPAPALADLDQGGEAHDPPEREHVSDQVHAERLRTMAESLVRVADTLTGSEQEATSDQNRLT